MPKHSVRRPIFGILSILTPPASWITTWLAMEHARATAHSGEILADLGPFLLGLILGSSLTFAFGLAALLRVERFRWLGLPPCIAGGLGLLLVLRIYFH